MDAAEYKAMGYRVSLQVSQPEIDRAERDVIAAYVSKVTTYDSADGTHKEAVMQLASILLLRRSAVATRSGGKVKQSPAESSAGYPEQCDIDNADRLLREINTVGSMVSQLVDDICGIYYRQTFVGL